MTRDEMLEALRYALDVSATEGGRFCEVGCRTVRAALAALESEEVVAEGWAFVQERPKGVWEFAFLQGRSPSARRVRILAVKGE